MTGTKAETQLVQLRRLRGELGDAWMACAGNLDSEIRGAWPVGRPCGNWFGTFVRVAAATGETDPRWLAGALDAMIAREEAAEAARTADGEVVELLRRLLAVLETQQAPAAPAGRESGRRIAADANPATTNREGAP